MRKKCPLCQKTNHTFQKIGIHKVIQCSNCNLNYLPNENIEFDEKKYYSNYFEKLRSDFNDESYLKRLKQTKIDAKHLNNISPVGNVLDIGCSTGEMIYQLNSIGDYDFVGCDLDLSAINYASKKYSNLKNMNFSPQNLLEINFKKKFDIIIFRGTLQYLAWDLCKTFDLLKRILKKRGKIFIYSLPNSESFIYHLLKDKWHMFDSKEHQTIFNRKSLIYLKKKFSLKIDELTYPYLETPYCDLKNDYKRVVDIIKNKSDKGTAFWGSTIQCVLVNN